MTNYELTYKPYGSSAILIEWPKLISPDILDDVLLLKEILIQNIVKEKVEIVSSYNSILVSYNENIEIFNELISKLKGYRNLRSKSRNLERKLWHIPVCYDVSFGLDINELALTKAISVQQIINLHTKAQYLVYGLGFLPGFMYLGGLETKLHSPRKKSPRLQVAKGAVGIGENQTGIYPNESPGGWNIIGNSPISFFNKNEEPPCFASVGDKIQFYEIRKQEHSIIESLVADGIYEPKFEVIND